MMGDYTMGKSGRWGARRAQGDAVFDAGGIVGAEVGLAVDGAEGIVAGGTLVADDSAATPGYGFDAAFRRELIRVLPAERLERLPADHTVFKSFFLVRTVVGARVVSPFLEGVAVQGRTAVILSPNDLLGAFARDPLGRWIDPCLPGGERQRRLAFHLGVNIVMYALCGDYKQDRIHLPFLRQRI